MPGRQEGRQQQHARGDIGVLHERRIRLPAHFQIAEKLVGRSHEAGLQRDQQPPVVGSQARDAKRPAQRPPGSQRTQTASA